LGKRSIDDKGRLVDCLVDWYEVGGKRLEVLLERRRQVRGSDERR
jgi:hypothetical protein